MSNSKSEKSGLTLRASIVSYSETIDELMLTVSSLVSALDNVKEKFRRISRITIINNNPRRVLNPNFMRDSLIDCLHCKIHVVQGHGNLGYGGGHALAFNSSQEDFHLFLNPDLEIDENAIRVGLSYLLENPEVGMVSPNAINADNKKQYLCKRFPSVFDLLLRGFAPRCVKALFARRLADYEMQDLSELKPTLGIPIISGCFMLCRRQVVADAGSFDTDYFMYFEDFDLSMRLGEISDIAYLPDMKIRHLGGNTARKGIKHILMFGRSGVKFFNKYGWRCF